MSWQYWGMAMSTGSTIKMSMLVRFQSSKFKDVSSKIYWPYSLVFCEPPMLWIWEPSWTEMKNTCFIFKLHIDECNSPLKCKERTQEHKDVPFLVVFLLGCYWETGTGRDSWYCYGHRWGGSQSYIVKQWNSGRDLSCDLEGFGNGLEVFQKRVPDWPPFAVTPPASASSDMWMRWTSSAAVRNVVQAYFIQLN